MKQGGPPFRESDVNTAETGLVGLSANKRDFHRGMTWDHNGLRLFPGVVRPASLHPRSELENRQEPNGTAVNSDCSVHVSVLRGS